MKIIHFADLHIGSKFERMPEDIKAELNTKLRNAFSRFYGRYVIGLFGGVATGTWS